MLNLSTLYSLHCMPARQGSQTQIHQGATFGWKMSPPAAVLNKKGSAGHKMKKNAIFSAKLDHT
jgi:hypothetical protein